MPVTGPSRPYLNPRRAPSLAARLLVPLLIVVVSVMSGFAILSLIQRERTLVAEAHRETQAYATALGLAFDAAFADADAASIPAIIQRISRQTSIYEIVVYDISARPIHSSGDLFDGRRGTPEEVRRVLGSGTPSAFERSVNEMDVYSVVRPILDDEGAVVAAFEVLQRLSFVEQEKARTRMRFLLNTVVLLLTMSGLLFWLVRRLVSKPLERFSAGVRALGMGRLEYRVSSDATIGELATVAADLNRMAASLERARGELVRGAEERLALERQVRQAEKMAVIGQLSAAIAHEIGAPLHVIRGRADLVSRRGARPEAEVRDLRIIVEQIDRITRIVKNLLDFARHRDPTLAPVEMTEVIDDVLELLSVELGPAGIQARRSGASSAVVLGDRDQLQQVMLNLVLNAVEALGDVDEPRRIEIAVGRRDEGGADEVTVAVVDSGPGIADANRERVFEPFFTTKGEQAGTGLGLAVARWIIEDHGGRVSVPPTNGRGASLAVRLPAHEAEPGVD